LEVNEPAFSLNGILQSIIMKKYLVLVKLVGHLILLKPLKKVQFSQNLEIIQNLLLEKLNLREQGVLNLVGLNNMSGLSTTD